MNATDLQLLTRYSREHAEDAFAEVVRRHLNLVYSAALRQVRSPQLAEEVAQSAFTDLARSAPRLAPNTILAAWLYQVTRRTAIEFVRREARRQLREEIANEMHAMNASTADWALIEPLLDDAMQALDDTDRAAILLRYFENKSLREVGQALGTSDNAAQKRVSRAVEHLREFFAKQGFSVGASGLIIGISANAVQAAPAGLAVTISTAGALVGATMTAVTETATKTIAMTALQKAFLSAASVAIVAIPFFIQNSALARARAEKSALLAKISNVPIAAPTAPRIENTEDRTRRDREELKSLRRESATLRARISDLSSQAQRLAAANPSRKFTGTTIGETLRLADVQDAGQATPAALVQTELWATIHGDTNRLAQLLAVSTETDKEKVQEMFEGLRKETTKGIDAMLAGTPIFEIRLIEEQPAEEDDRWIVGELVNKDGEIIRRARTRVRLTNGGWKLVVGIDGQPEEETVEDQP